MGSYKQIRNPVTSEWNLVGDDDPGGSLDHNMKHLMSKVVGLGLLVSSQWRFAFFLLKNMLWRK